ncbi:TlpA family protein disulfide reductase [Candidatus Palauibacter sp.]|uniref:TlpA family protein disulfide reductase n=1 Tax=Candidatus Palauibacter sp. TaxID=3101350 RepID=UPI003AF219D0
MMRDSVRQLSGLGAVAGLAAAVCASCADATTGRDRLLDAAAAIQGLSSVTYQYSYEGTGSAAGSFTGSVTLVRPADEPPLYLAELRPSPSWIPAAQDDDPPPALVLSGGGDHIAAHDEALARFSYGTVSGGSGHLVANAPFAVPSALTDPHPFEAELAGDLELVSQETVDGVLCDVLRGETDQFGAARVWWHIGVEDDLPRAFRWEAADGSGTLAFEVRELQVDPFISPDQLAIRMDVTDPEAGQVIDEDARPIEAGIPAPDWTLEAGDGSTLRLSELRGDIVVLNVWSSWCAPCRDLAAPLAALSDGWAGEGVRFLALNAWESPEIDASETAREWGLGAAVLVRAERIASDYKLVSVPALYVVDPRGDLALVRNPTLGDPEAQARELERVIRTLLGGDR